MELFVEQGNARVPVTILRVVGNLDGTSYLDFIEVAKKQYAAGARDFLIDLTDAPYVSSAGLVALHTLVKLSRGETQGDLQNGWGALHDIGQEGGKQFDPHIKLLNLQPKVRKVMDLAGVTTFLGEFTDRTAALASF